jgi:hypothetical protein
MIQLDPSLTLDSTAIWVLTIAVILVFSLHFYLQRLIGKRPRAESVPASRFSAARRAKPVADGRGANVKR